jgi:hypothetical protein
MVLTSGYNVFCVPKGEREREMEREREELFRTHGPDFLQLSLQQGPPQSRTGISA